MNEDEKHDMRMDMGQQIMGLADVMTTDAVQDAIEATLGATNTLITLLREQDLHPDVIAGVVLGVIVGPALKGTP